MFDHLFIPQWQSPPALRCLASLCHCLESQLSLCLAARPMIDAPAYRPHDEHAAQQHQDYTRQKCTARYAWAIIEARVRTTARRHGTGACDLILLSPSTSDVHKVGVDLRSHNRVGLRRWVRMVAADFPSSVCVGFYAGCLCCRRGSGRNLTDHLMQAHPATSLCTMQRASRFKKCHRHRDR